MIEWKEAASPLARLILAHGAGAGKDSEFMQAMAQMLAAQGISTGLFNFPYMQTAMDTGTRRPPDRAPKLLACFAEMVAEAPDDLPLFIGGKSMGGRMASMLVCEQSLTKSISGILAFGYPFHPPGKPSTLRTEHFADIPVPFMVLQGERDTFGTREELTAMPLPGEVEFVWLPDGDHSLVPRKKSGFSQNDNWQNAAQDAAAFIKRTLHG